MNDKNQTIINFSKKFDLSYCVYSVLYDKTNYRYKLTDKDGNPLLKLSNYKKVSFNNYKLVDEDGNPTLKISGFKKVNYRYDIDKFLRDGKEQQCSAMN